MKLSEAIKHAEVKGNYSGLCANEHHQLADWLKELQRLRKKVRSRGLAVEIVDDLFNGGDGKKVQRLVLETSDIHFHGAAGWCHEAICDVIQDHLKGEI